MSAFIYFVVLVVVVAFVAALSPWNNGSSSSTSSKLRRLVERENSRDLSEYYFTLNANTLGRPNHDVAIGNPLKGLIESPLYTFPPYQADIPLAMEFYYIGLNEIMKGNPKDVGEQAAFDWKVMDEALAGSASRKMHAVFRVIIHFPGKALMMPKYLLDAGVEIKWSSEGQSPYYGNAILLEALQQFISSYGKRYNGDKRLGFVQAGLLGFWGEWHTHGDAYIPASTEESVIRWYAAAFPATKVQLRYPRASGYQAGFGLHDDSFAIRTLDGLENGGQIKHYYFWPSVVSAGQTDFYKKGPMGGETGISIQTEVFEPWYNAGSFEKQSFMSCVTTTHATYMFHHAAFKDGGFKGTELENARHAHSHMGYNYHVSNIAVKTSSVAGLVDIDVVMSQIGVAPFYYDLNLALDCSGMNKQSLPVKDLLDDYEDSHVFKFVNVPSARACLDRVMLKLESSYAYVGRPIRFAQGNGTVAFTVPTPGPVAPAPAPVKVPASAPVKVPASAPVKVPVPVAAPVKLPVSAPVQMDDDVLAADIRLVLIDTTTDNDIVVMTDEMTVDLTIAKAFNVRADPASSFGVGSVAFYYDGFLFKTENSSPFAMAGHDGYTFNDWIPSIGEHTITAVPYSKDNGQGTIGTGVWISFTVVKGPIAPSPVVPMPIPIPVPVLVSVPVAAPLKAPVPAAAPVKIPVGVPVAVPVKAPVKLPVAPAPAPVKAPKAPTRAPTVPTAAPVKPPTPAPVLLTNAPIRAPVPIVALPTPRLVPKGPTLAPARPSSNATVPEAPTAAPAVPKSKAAVCRAKPKLFSRLVCFLFG